MTHGHRVAPDWQPSAGLDALRQRAELLLVIRDFFRQRGVLEVETPLLARCGAPDVQIRSFPVTDAAGHQYYLQTSPEYAMKRLLAAGSGPVYQLCKAFRDDEQGRLHNPEFTMLEWYRPGLDPGRLVDEVVALLHRVLGELRVHHLSYRGAFLQYLGLDPLAAADAELRGPAVALGLNEASADGAARDELLDFLFSLGLQPALAELGVVVIRDYPASQAALARLLPGQPELADRFEIFVRGVELANGYGELLDAGELRRRFDVDRDRRHQRGLAPMAPDRRLLGAMEAGLPECSGVALGVDRLLMLQIGAGHIDEVLAFPADRA